MRPLLKKYFKAFAWFALLAMFILLGGSSTFASTNDNSKNVILEDHQIRTLAAGNQFPADVNTGAFTVSCGTSELSLSDNTKYTGLTMGTERAGWLARINNPDNWTQNTNSINVSKGQS